MWCREARERPRRSVHISSYKINHSKKEKHKKTMDDKRTRRCWSVFSPPTQTSLTWTQQSCCCSSCGKQSRVSSRLHLQEEVGREGRNVKCYCQGGVRLHIVARQLADTKTYRLRQPSWTGWQWTSWKHWGSWRMTCRSSFSEQPA